MYSLEILSSIPSKSGGALSASDLVEEVLDRLSKDTLSLRDSINSRSAALDTP